MNIEQYIGKDVRVTLKNGAVYEGKLIYDIGSDGSYLIKSKYEDNLKVRRIVCGKIQNIEKITIVNTINEIVIPFGISIANTIADIYVQVDSAIKRLPLELRKEIAQRKFGNPTIVQDKRGGECIRITRMNDGDEPMLLIFRMAKLIEEFRDDVFSQAQKIIASWLQTEHKEN